MTEQDRSQDCTGWTAERIRALSRLAGSQQKLADRLGVRLETVNRWCNGRNRPRTKPILRRLECVERWAERLQRRREEERKHRQMKELFRRLRERGVKPRIG